MFAYIYMIITVNMLFLLLFEKRIQSIVLTVKEMQKYSDEIGCR